MDPQTSETPKYEKNFFVQAQSRFKLAEEAEAETRKQSLDDLKFRVGDQWDANVKSDRELQSKPCLTINRLQEFVRQVVNEYRQQRPAGKIDPVGDGASVDEAQIMQGLIRHIEYSSDAEIAYDTAFEQMVTCGFAWMRLFTYYVDDDSGDQEIGIARIQNPFSVLTDPYAIKPCREDMRWGFVFEDLDKEVYKARYPDSDLASMSDWTALGDMQPGWVSKDSCRVAEYWYVEDEARNLTTKDGQEPTPKATGTEISSVGKKRKKRTIRCDIINGIETLEPGTWSGNNIGLIPMFGDDLMVDGKRYNAGIIRNAKDAQRAYNFHLSSATEMEQLMNKSTYIAAEGQLEGHETKWQTANRQNHAYLYYKAKIAGVTDTLPPPQRDTAEPPIQAIVELLKISDSDLRSTTGIQNPSLGVDEGDRSGDAIRRMQKQGQLSTLNFSDNAVRSIRCIIRYCLDLIPEVYDSARIIRIVKPDKTVEPVIVHNGNPDDAQTMADQENIKKILDVGKGRYDVRVDVGPSYETKRQENVMAIGEVIQADPALMPILGDIYFANMDWEGAQEAARRMKIGLPPQYHEDPGGPEAQLSQARQQLQQMAQQHNILTQHVNELTQVINSKQVETKGKVEIEKFKVTSDQVIALAKIQATVTVAEIGAKTQSASDRAEFTHDAFVETHNAAHELAMAGVQNDQANQQQASQQGHEAAQDAGSQNAAAQQQQSAQDAAAQQAQQQQGGE